VIDAERGARFVHSRAPTHAAAVERLKDADGIAGSRRDCGGRFARIGPLQAEFAT